MKPEQFIDPYLLQTWEALGARVLSSGNRVDITLGYPAKGIEATLQDKLQDFLGSSVDLTIHFRPPASRGLERVKHIIAVASGKGGVGKSTTAVNLALGLSMEGASVGLLDADIYGPSQGMMLGVPEGQRPEITEDKYFIPIEAHGIQAMSMSFLVDQDTPVVWRGPMVSGALQQLLNQSLWDDLDYLIVDMPPGTGDIQLTLSQQVPVSGTVIVTTPQDIALLDARKGIEMFSKVDIPVLGILENMSGFVCPKCGEVSSIFGVGGGAKIAEQTDVPLLGELPLDMTIREQADGGVPTVVTDPSGQLADIYREASRHMAAKLWSLASSLTRKPTEISLVDD